MDFVKRVKNKNKKSGFVSFTPDELLTIVNEASTLKVTTFGGKVLCKQQVVTVEMIATAIKNKVAIEGARRNYYLMPYK